MRGKQGFIALTTTGMKLSRAIDDHQRQKGEFPFLSSWPNHWN
jgi:hypothetical protein